LPHRSAEPQPALGAAVRLLRRERGLTQEKLGLEADMTSAWLSYLENGRINPTWGTMRRLAAALGVSLADLAERAERLEAEMRGGD
jgi:transcriptional regulator with XRE-family HTH domain